MPEKRDIDAEQNAAVDKFGPEVIRLIHSGLKERPFGHLTVKVSWKAGVLHRLETSEGGEQLLMLPPAAVMRS